MMTFYKFFKGKNKQVFVFCTFIFVHLILAKSLFDSGQRSLEELNLIDQHTQIQMALGENLAFTCNLFSNNDKIEELRGKISSTPYDFYVTREPAISVDNLIFYKLKFKTYVKKQSDFGYLSTGYYVEDKISKNCFGLI